jgi:hypothetical protein
MSKTGRKWSLRSRLRNGWQELPVGPLALSGRPVACGVLVAATLALPSTLGTTIALAQGHPLECSCLIPQSMIIDVEVAARIVQGSNLVLASSGAGWQPATAGQQLSIADSVQTGPNSAATIAIGDQCLVEMGPQTTLTINPVATDYCIAMSQPGSEVAGSGGNIILPILGIAAIGGGVAALVGTGSDSPASP